VPTPVRTTIVIAAALALGITGCATQTTPYQPLSASSRASGGYSDVRLAPDRFEVTFAGNRFTSREQVEAALLYRAAELTVQQGFDWFVVEDRELERQVERELRRDPFYDPWFYRDYGTWQPYWRYYGPGMGWKSWYPYYGDPFWASAVDARTVERFEAKAEIKLERGAKPADKRKAFDAREVMARIGPQILKPKQ
jgi:hypothetical protein